MKELQYDMISLCPGPGFLFSTTRLCSSGLPSVCPRSSDGSATAGNCSANQINSIPSRTSFEGCLLPPKNSFSPPQMGPATCFTISSFPFQ